MSFKITTAFVQQYHDTISQEIQQTVSKLRDLVRVETLKGKEGFFDYVGATEMVEKVTRHGDTPLVETPHGRRKVTAATFEWADLVDDPDIAATLVNPTNAYMEAGLAAARRKFDQLIIAAANATAYTGVAGATGVPLPAGQLVGVQVGGSSTDVGLNLAKLRAARKIFRKNEVPEDWPLYMAVNADMIDALLADSTLTSADYNTVRALADGNVKSFMGFTFVHSELLGALATPASGHTAAIAWAKPGLLLAVGIDITTDVSKRPDKSNSTQPYIMLKAGATRMDEKLVVEIACQDPA